MNWGNDPSHSHYGSAQGHYYDGPGPLPAARRKAHTPSRPEASLPPVAVIALVLVSPRWSKK